MNEKQSTTDVLIDGKVYSLQGADPAYLQKVSGYINSKIAEIKTSRSYRGLDADYRQLFLNLNIADDYFRSEDEKAALEEKAAGLEKELYSMKHEAVNTRLKLENSLRQQSALEKSLEEWKDKYLKEIKNAGEE